MIFGIFLVSSFLISLIYYIIKKGNEVLIFNPTKSTKSTFEILCLHKNVMRCQMKTPDGNDIYGILYNECKKPDWNDTIIIYSHGNSGCIEQMVEYNIRIGDIIPNLCIKNYEVKYSKDALYMLSQYGSVFIYDYRGYGISSGKPSEKGMYIDIKCVWDYITKKKEVNPNKIILYGFSLGTAVSSNLCVELCLSNKKLPRAMIMESPISSIKDMAKYHFNTLRHFVTYDFDNIKNLKVINNSLPIYIIHSMSDERVPYSQGIELSKYIENKIIDIDGTHNSPVYNKNVYNLLQKLSE